DPGTRQPRHGRQGGSYQASQVFGAFAKQQPGRAMSIIDRLEAGTQESPAGSAIYNFADNQTVDPRLVVDLIQRLHGRGFATRDFRDWTAWAMRKLAIRCNGLSDEICEVLKSWLAPATGDETEKPKKLDDTAEPRSLLWSPSHGGGGALPHGNYPA